MKTLSTETFDTLYRALNLEQKKAVEAVEGPVMVIAGPGTGKTYMLTLRIANILRLTDTAPESILALTFTESAAYAMRSRLVEIVGSAGYRVHIHTFHGFCNGIIERYPESFERIIGSFPASAIDQIRILEEAINTTRLELLKPYGNKYHYVIPVLSAIRDLKREAVRPLDLRARLESERKAFAAISDRFYEGGRYAGRMKGVYRTREKEIEKHRELLTLYRRYERALRDRRLYDYEDMIMETVAALEADPDLLLRLQERYQYILADEHQDANQAQNRLLTLLSSFHDNPNLFVVGDEKQAIFRFQGASLLNFLSFMRRYPEALIVRLTDNYRSRQFILDAAASVIANNPVPDEALRVRLKARGAAERGEDSTDEVKVSVLGFSSPSVEQYFIARDIRDAIARGMAPEEIAVLYRDNRDARPVARALEALNVPYAILSDESILDDPEIQKLVTLLSAVDAPHRREAVGRALFIDFLGIDVYDTYQVFAMLARLRRDRGENKHRSTIDSLLRSRVTLEDAGVRDPDALAARYRKLLSWSSFAQNRGLMETLELVARESGFFVHAMGLPDGAATIRKFDRLIEEFSRTVPGHRAYTLRDALRHLETLAFYRVPIRARSEERDPNGVRLMTAHRSKGLEFDRVYVTGATDGHWGNRSRPALFGKELLLGPVAAAPEEADTDTTDERRLFYVALTRARRSVVIAYAKRNDAGGPVLPSQFVEELDPAYTRLVPTESLEEELQTLKNEARSHPVLPRKRLFASKEGTDDVDPETRGFLRSLFDDRGFSVSALNNYLTCPWRYFFENLIRLPKAPNRHQLYGIAMHAALKRLFDDAKFGRRPSKARCFETFRRSLEHQPLSERDFTESLEKGSAALDGYIDTRQGKFDRPIETEFAIRGVALHEGVGGSDPPTASVRLTGILDKIDPANPAEAGSGASRKAVMVTDFKTGRPRSRNYIEGHTRDSTGDYKRQLVFYRLLLDRFADGKFAMTAGEIDFVEPDDRGRYHCERFEVSDAEVAELEATIGRVAGEIRKLAFWNTRCEDEKCEYCKLRAMMRG